MKVGLETGREMSQFGWNMSQIGREKCQIGAEYEYDSMNTMSETGQIGTEYESDEWKRAENKSDY